MFSLNVSQAVDMSVISPGWNGLSDLTFMVDLFHILFVPIIIYDILLLKAIQVITV